MRVTLFLIFIVAARAFRFTAPPRLASFGEIYSVYPRSVEFAVGGYLNQNFSVFIPPDYTGCAAPSISLPPLVVVWLYLPVPCSRLSSPYNLLDIYAGWQQAGASGSIVGSASKVPADWVGALGTNGRSDSVTIPVEWFQYLYNTTIDGFGGNPVVSSLEFLFVPGFNNITLQYSYPRRSIWQLQQFELGAPYSGIQWTAYAMSLVGLIICSFRLGSFVLLEGPKMSLPQTSLSLFIISLLILHVFYTGGTTSGNFFWPFQVATALNYYWQPFYLGAIFVYSFYLLEMCFLGKGSSSSTTLQWFMVPSLICTGLVMLCVVVTGAILATLPSPSLQFTQATLAVSGCLLVCFGLAFLLLSVVTVIVVLSLLGARNELIWRLLIVNLIVLLTLAFSFASHVITALQNQPGGAFQSTRNFYVFLAFSSFSPWLAALAIAFNFRISVQKELEVSKSATSATSSASSAESRSTSASSSNSADPVIEL